MRIYERCVRCTGCTPHLIKSEIIQILVSTLFDFEIKLTKVETQIRTGGRVTFFVGGPGLETPASLADLFVAMVTDIVLKYKRNFKHSDFQCLTVSTVYTKHIRL